ncbi:hypothetical protein [Parvularcula sp. LCG005]|uniref:hypothetical protein n=1 Tax=Parvularcula sp. LCG005 TaxID=3078805 RepID=UPI0029439AAA|nr:hypothetical protein [Parvularcula sp. LCG005]WOI51982.1 hypothetical protein RUI03_07410 [Parvularcula sp. LCG005]
MMLTVSLALVITQMSRFSFPCENTIVQRLASPGSRHTAFLFERGCGATTGFSGHVSIVGSGSTPNGAGNVLIAERKNGPSGSETYHGPSIIMRWQDETTLIVSLDPEARVFKQETVFGDIQVLYTD